jgi:signal recognition particle subunit SRP54
VDHTEAMKTVQKLKSGKGFDLEDFKAQMQQMKKLGGLSSLVDKLPGRARSAPGNWPRARSRWRASRASSTA